MIYFNETYDISKEDVQKFKNLERSLPAEYKTLPIDWEATESAAQSFSDIFVDPMSARLRDARVSPLSQDDKEALRKARKRDPSGWGPGSLEENKKFQRSKKLKIIIENNKKKQYNKIKKKRFKIIIS